MYTSIESTESMLINHGVPVELARHCAEILDKQRQGLLSSPLQEPELSVVRSAWWQTSAAPQCETEYEAQGEYGIEPR